MSRLPSPTVEHACTRRAKARWGLGSVNALAPSACWSLIGSMQFVDYSNERWLSIHRPGQFTTIERNQMLRELATHAHYLRRLACAGIGLTILSLAGCGSGGGLESNSGGNEPGNGSEPGSGGGVGGPGEPGAPLGWAPEFTVENDSSSERTETILASVPFPFGHHMHTEELVVSGHQTGWRVLQRWRDGSIRVAQAQFTDTLGPNEQKAYHVAGGSPSQSGSFVQNAWVANAAGSLQIGAEVLDTFNVSYRSFTSGGGETLTETPLHRVKRHRTYHTAASGGIGRDYLTSTFYLQEFRDVPVVVVDWVLGNDYLGSDSPNGSLDPNMYALGGADINEARFLVGGQGVTPLPFRASHNEIESGQSVAGGLTGFEVMSNSWIGDGQTRRYRFVLYVAHQNASPGDIQRWSDTAQAMQATPLYPLATHQSWNTTGSLGLLGGPIAGPTNSWARAEGDYDQFWNSQFFGTWGSRGDPMPTGTTGTPRNHPLSPDLAHAVQGGHNRLISVLEEKAWIQACRPYHLYDLTVGDEQLLFLADGIPVYPGSRDLSHESLGRRQIVNNDPWPAYRSRVLTGWSHSRGWEHFDHEHWSSDLLFDYWTVTGDCWAQEELRQLGQTLKSMMRLSTYNTQYIQAVRAEGWTMQGFVQSYLATGDEDLKAYALRRVHENVDGQRHVNHPSKALGYQENYGGTTWPLQHEFTMAWQHGALLYGYLGAYRHWEDDTLLEICEDVPTTVEYSWVTNYNHSTMGFVADGLRYYTAISHNGNPVPANHWDASHGIRFGDSPLGGAHVMLVAPLLLLADMTGDQAVRDKALYYGELLRQGPIGTACWDKWFYVLPEHHAQ